MAREWPPVTELAQRQTVRLVAAQYLNEPALAPLAEDADALADLEALESATSGRLAAEESGLPDLDPRELVFGRQGYSYINASFAYTRKGGNRFNDENRGAWYCAFEAATSLAEVAYHIGRELQAIGRFETSSRFGELRADFYGAFHDLRAPFDDAGAVLSADTSLGYPAGQGLARELRLNLHSNGVVYPSVRAEGVCLACFRPDMIQNVRRGGNWTLSWAGSPSPTINADP